MPNSAEYEVKIGQILKSEIKRAGHTYASLTAILNEMGISEKEANVRNKIGRGKFSASFMLQCLEALKIKELRL